MITPIRILVLATFILVPSTYQKEAEIEWKKLDEGLHHAEYTSPMKSDIGDNLITILKINPSYYNFNLFSAKEKGQTTKTVPKWAKAENQIAVINAGMYRADHATNVGYMKDFGFTNNSNLNKDNTLVAFNRKDKSVPEFQIIDRTCQDWDSLKTKYNSFSQSIRMVDCNQKNRWGKQTKKWSMVVIGTDKDGNALFIFSRSPYTVHDLISVLLKAPLQLNNLMYLEGGPEASFYLKHGSTEIAKMGSYETGFLESDENEVFWRVPNVIGIRKK